VSRKMKVIISVLVAVLLLTVGGTVALADEEPTPQSGVNRLLDRVAGILGIEQEELADAFNQARQEMQEEQQQWCEEYPEECQQSQEMRQQKWQEKWQERWGASSWESRGKRAPYSRGGWGDRGMVAE